MLHQTFLSHQWHPSFFLSVHLWIVSRKLVKCFLFFYHSETLGGVSLFLKAFKSTYDYIFISCFVSYVASVTVSDYKSLSPKQLNGRILEYTTYDTSIFSLSAAWISFAQFTQLKCVCSAMRKQLILFLSVWLFNIPIRIQTRLDRFCQQLSLTAPLHYYCDPLEDFQTLLSFSQQISRISYLIKHLSCDSFGASLKLMITTCYSWWNADISQYLR